MPYQAKLRSAVLWVALVWMLATLGTAAASNAPLPSAARGVHQLLPPIEGELCPGEMLPFDFTVTIPATPVRGDIVFAIDTTGSMGGVIRAAQENALAIMEDLNELIPDVQFGVIDVEDYPTDPYGQPVNVAYRLRQGVTDDREAVRTAINEMVANAGGDLPEAYTRTFYEAFADPEIGWRPGARRLLLFFGDSVPHDDNLNEGFERPPYVPPGRTDGIWRTGHPPAYLDPGRDGVPGTEDDLDFQTVLQGLKDSEVTLLVVVTSSTFPAPDQRGLVVYWNHWAGITGGRAVPLWNASDLPEVIRDLVKGTITHINRLAIEADPEWFNDWVFTEPPEMGPIEIPPAGHVFPFFGRIVVPDGTPPGTYHFMLRAIGDGYVYGEKPVTIVVRSDCAPPALNRWYYLPLVARNYGGVGAPQAP